MFDVLEGPSGSALEDIVPRVRCTAGSRQRVALRHGLI